MELLLIALGTYGVTTLLVEYDGPFGIFYILRRKDKSRLMTCSACLGVWIAAFIALVVYFEPALAYILAGFGLFLFMERQ